MQKGDRTLTLREVHRIAITGASYKGGTTLATNIRNAIGPKCGLIDISIPTLVARSIGRHKADEVMPNVSDHQFVTLAQAKIMAFNIQVYLEDEMREKYEYTVSHRCSLDMAAHHLQQIPPNSHDKDLIARAIEHADFYDLIIFCPIFSGVIEDNQIRSTIREDLLGVQENIRILIDQNDLWDKTVHMSNNKPTDSRERIGELISLMAAKGMRLPE